MKFLIFPEKKALFIFQEMKTPKHLPIFFQKKAFLIFQKTKTLKNVRKLYFRKRNFLIFQKVFPKPQKPKFIIRLEKKALTKFF